MHENDVKVRVRSILMTVCFASTGAYALAIMQCECGLLSLVDAAATLTSWGTFQFSVIVPVAMLAVEAVIVGWRNSSLAILLRWDRSVKTDFLYWALQFTVVQQIIIFLTTAGLYAPLNALADRYSLKIAVVSNPILQVFIIFMVTDIGAYWVHRWLHKSHFMWEAHKVHHSATSFNMMMAFRTHPLERAIWEGVNILLFLMLGATFGTYVVFTMIYYILGVIQHSRVDWDFGLLGKIFVSPTFHRFHHSIKRVDFDKNFGARLVIWDKLFGTYSEEIISPETVGVEENTYAENPVHIEFFRPYYEFASRLFGISRKKEESITS